VLVPLILTVAACTGGTSSPPEVLSDGSLARPPPVRLQGIDGPSVMTRARVVRRASVASQSRIARCFGSPGDVATAVERIGVSGLSVTFRGPDDRAVYGCDATESEATAGSPWCGRAFGRLHAGRLRDPRLSITCHAGDELLGFAWVDPAEHASYVVVHRHGYGEVYPVAGDLPVRVVSDDVDADRAIAAFSLAEYSRDGRQLRRYVMEAQVSG
jgi:hypothetical protein